MIKGDEEICADVSGKNRKLKEVVWRELKERNKGKNRGTDIVDRLWHIHDINQLMMNMLKQK